MSESSEGVGPEFHVFGLTVALSPWLDGTERVGLRAFSAQASLQSGKPGLWDGTPRAPGRGEGLENEGLPSKFRA